MSGNASPILRFFLSGADDLINRVSQNLREPAAGSVEYSARRISPPRPS